MATRMQQRRGTAAQWTSANPTLAAGEIGFETDTNKFKIGNGTSTWSSLSYYASADDISDIIDGAPELLNTLGELASALGDDPTFFTTVATNLSDHEADSTNIHGITDTAQLVTLSDSQTLSNKTIDSPTLSGVPLSTTPLPHDNSTKIATTQYVQVELGYLINNAPDAMNTLNELSQALGDDPNFATTVTNNISTKVSKAGDTMTGALTLSGDPTENLHAATKQYADTAVGTHNGVTTSVHGINDTADLATKSYADDAVSDHGGTTTSVHGIANTADLATKSYADTAVGTHSGTTTSVHGIDDTSALATQTDVSDAITAHDVTTNVHGIADTSVLATQTDVSDAITAHNVTTNVHGIADTAALATKEYADDAVSTHNSESTNVHGIADTADIVLTDDARLSDTRTPTDDTVSTEKIVNSSVTSDKLAGNSVTEAKIADGAVTSGKIADGAIVNADINAAAAIDWTKLGISSTVSSTELGYVAGVTSAIQTQIDAVPGLIATAKSEAIADATAQVSAVIDSAPAALDTLNELAAALGDDANFASTVTTALDGKVASYTPIIQKTDSYTLSSLSERDSLIEMGKATAQTVTIPTNASVAYPVGTSLDILQTGAGQVTVAGASGVTVNGTPGLKLRTQWSSATLFKRAENTWIVMGDLSA